MQQGKESRSGGEEKEVGRVGALTPFTTLIHRREADAEEKTTEHHLRSLNILKKRILESPTKKSDPALIARVSALEKHLLSG